MIENTMKEIEYDRFRMKNRHILEGSFTVEAAGIMTIVLPILVALIYAGFYVHDQTYLQGAACEAAVMGSNLMLEDDRNARVQTLMQELIAGRMLGSQNAGGNAGVSEDRSSADGNSVFSVPGMAVQLFGNGEFAISAEWNRELFHPARSIRKIRGVHYLLSRE